MDCHWTAKLTPMEIEVIGKFSCSKEWLDSFTYEWEANLEAENAPRLNEGNLNREEKEALQSLEVNAYVWPDGPREWTLDEYGLPIYLAILGRESSCTIETI